MGLTLEECYKLAKNGFKISVKGNKIIIELEMESVF